MYVVVESCIICAHEFAHLLKCSYTRSSSYLPIHKTVNVFLFFKREKEKLLS